MNTQELILSAKITHLDTKVDELGEGFNYKGSVTNVASLPATGTLGDMYTVAAEKNARYVWNGTTWIKTMSGADAGSVDYDSTATYSSGTVGNALNQHSSQIDDIEEKTATFYRDSQGYLCEY